MTQLDPAEFENLLSEAVKHNRQPNFMFALNSLQKAVARLQLELAVSQYQQPVQWEEARAKFEAAAKSEEYLVQIQALTYLAILATRQKNYHYALKLYSDAIGCAQEQKDKTQLGLLHYNRGKLYQELKHLTDAEKEYRRAIENDPTDPDKLQALGELYLKRGWVDRAEKVWQEAHQLLPQNPSTTTDLATVLMCRRKYGEALQLYQQLIEQGYQNSRLYEGLGTCQIALEDYKSAEKAFGEAHKLEKKALTFGNLGALRYAQDNSEAALRAYKQAIETG